MMLVSLISYIDRNALALLAPTILRDTHLSGEQYGWIVSGFSVAYMIGNPVWGTLIDKWGLRTGMSVAVAIWTIASASHAFASGFLTFLIARAVLGFGEGATFPGGLRTATQTLPHTMQSRGIAVAYSGGSLGAVITPLIVTPVTVAFGWRGAFLFTGLIGLLWLILWGLVSRHFPAKTVFVQAAETAAAIRIRDRRVWAFICLYALGALPLGFVLYGASLYLSRVRGVSQVELGTLLWIPPMGWEIGYFFWAWISDRFRAAHGQTGRLIFGALGLASLSLAIGPLLQPVWVLMLEMFLAMFLASGFVILSVAWATGTFGTRSSGLIAGIGAGSWSAGVALFMPLAGRLFDTGQYNLAFTLASIVPVFGSAGFLLLTRRSRRSEDRAPELV